MRPTGSLARPGATNCTDGDLVGTGAWACAEQSAKTTPGRACGLQCVEPAWRSPLPRPVERATGEQSCRAPYAAEKRRFGTARSTRLMGALPAPEGVSVAPMRAATEPPSASSRRTDRASEATRVRGVWPPVWTARRTVPRHMLHEGSAIPNRRSSDRSGGTPPR